MVKLSRLWLACSLIVAFTWLGACGGDEASPSSHFGAGASGMGDHAAGASGVSGRVGTPGVSGSAGMSGASDAAGDGGDASAAGGAAGEAGGAIGQAGEAGAGGAPGRVIQNDTLCKEFGPLLCGRYRQCFGDIFDQAQCEAGYTFLCLPELTGNVAGSALDLKQVGACLDALRTSSCDSLDYTNYAGPCNFVPIIPAAKLGAACSVNSQTCVEGTCVAGTSGSCPTCVAAAALHASCSDRPCASGSFCDDAKKCQPLLPQGAPCSHNEQCDQLICSAASGSAVCSEPSPLGGKCGYDGDCGRGGTTYCDQTVAGGACTALPPLGGQCVNAAYGDRCLDKDATCLEGICQKVVPHTRAAGTECDDPYAQCADGLYCRGGTSALREGLCAVRLKAGQACDPNDLQACHAGLVCPHGRCEPAALLGAPCAARSACLQGQCVADTVDGFSNGGTGHCALYTQPNQPCDYSLPVCTSGYFCSDAKLCTARLENGEACTASSQCAAGSCAGGQCALNICQQ